MLTNDINIVLKALADFEKLIVSDKSTKGGIFYPYTIVSNTYSVAYEIVKQLKSKYPAIKFSNLTGDLVIHIEFEVV